ncbi:MAG: DUF4397 domain-containing protein [Acidimicrobiales bacterium]
MTRRWWARAVLAWVALPAGLVVSGGPGAGAQAGVVEVRIVQGLPEQTVDLYADRLVVARSVPPFGVAPGLPIPPGEFVLSARPAGAGAAAAPLAQAAAVVPAGASAMTFVVHLGIDGTPRIAAFRDDRSPIEAGRARVAVHHVAAVPALAVALDDGALAPLLAPGSAVVRSLAPVSGLLSVREAQGGGQLRLASPDALLSANALTSLYVVGPLAGGELNVVAVATPLEVAPPAPTAVPTGSAGLVSPPAGVSAMAAGIAALSACALAAARRRRPRLLRRWRW